jgi:NH3-dependent NAD+ synthetase
MITARELLKIDEERVVAAMAEYLCNLCTQFGVKGVLAGLSGGIDSAVLFGLTMRCWGKARFRPCIYMIGIMSGVRVPTPGE